MIVIFPAPNALVKFVRWYYACLSFPDGTTITSELIEEHIKSPVRMIGLLLWVSLIGQLLVAGPLMQQLVNVVVSMVSAYFSFQLLRAVIGSTRSNSGSLLRFAGQLQEFLGWQAVFLVGMSILTLGPVLGLTPIVALCVIVLILAGIVFLAVVYMRWWASKMEGGSRRLTFHATAGSFALRYLGFILSSMLILTIPWTMLSMTKWLWRQFEIPVRTQPPLM